MSFMDESRNDYDGTEPLDSFEERLDYLTDEARDAAFRNLETVRGGLATLYEGVAQESSRAVATVERQVEEHPWISLLVSFGIGCLIGSALLRRD
jgi:ElaB/YqjD/DUF883 family membrane-anchored ribosome-binding protein